MTTKFFIQIYNKFKALYYIFRGYYTKDFKPIKCHKCGSTYLVSKNIASVDGVITEELFVCGSCNEKLATWDYGTFGPVFDKKNYLVKTLGDDIHYINIGYFDILLHHTEYGFMFTVNKFGKPSTLNPTSNVLFKDKDEMEKHLKSLLDAVEKQIKTFDKETALRDTQDARDNVTTLAKLLNKNI